MISLEMMNNYALGKSERIEYNVQFRTLGSRNGFWHTYNSDGQFRPFTNLKDARKVENKLKTRISEIRIDPSCQYTEVRIIQTLITEFSTVVE